MFYQITFVWSRHTDEGIPDRSSDQQRNHQALYSAWQDGPALLTPRLNYLQASWRTPGHRVVLSDSLAHPTTCMGRKSHIAGLEHQASHLSGFYMPGTHAVSKSGKVKWKLMQSLVLNMKGNFYTQIEEEQQIT